MSEMKNKKKVVFVDGGINKTARGHVEFVNGFVKVTDRRGHSILINKLHVIFIRDVIGDSEVDYDR